jgi:hypothetical protein
MKRRFDFAQTSKGISSRVRVAAFVGCALVIGPRALGELAGYEQVKNLVLECTAGDAESVKPRMIKKHVICTYDQRLCRVLSGKDFVVEAYVTADCEVKSLKASCPQIGICAQNGQLSSGIADEIRRMNDPNFASAPDGANDPVETSIRAIPK